VSTNSRPEWSNVLAVFDTETTGIAPDTTRIVSAYVGVLGADGSVTEGQEWLINPGIEIPAQATAVHGITTEFAQANGIDAADGVSQIVDVLNRFFTTGIPVVAYNAAYDFTILDREAVRYGISPLNQPKPIVDPLIIDKAVDRYRKGKRTLEVASQTYGVELSDAHNASADAIAAGRLAQAIAEKFASVLSCTAPELHDRQIQWAADQAASYAEWRRGQGLPVYADSGSWPVR